MKERCHCHELFEVRLRSKKECTRMHLEDILKSDRKFGPKPIDIIWAFLNMNKPTNIFAFHVSQVRQSLIFEKLSFVMF